MDIASNEAIHGLVTSGVAVDEARKIASWTREQDEAVFEAMEAEGECEHGLSAHLCMGPDHY